MELSGGLLSLEATIFSKIIGIPQNSQDSPLFLKEVCAGVGCLGLGAMLHGMPVLAQMDKNAACCRVLRANCSPMVLEMDITSAEAQHALHAVEPLKDVVLGAGFPCQPFSQQGDRLAMQDPRSSAFWGVLQSAFFMQAKAVVLECVPEARTNPDIRRGLCELSELMHYKMGEVVLPLHVQWPTRRTRWWVILAPDYVNLCDFIAWPQDERYNQVKTVIGTWPCWSRNEEEILLPTDHAMACFEDPAFGDDQRRLNLHGLCPTLLHSYGNALTGCPCGCRRQAFSEARLRRGGLRGVLVHSLVFEKLRYFHPKEMALLLAVPSQLKLGDDPYLALCLLGQIASPLQSIWVFGHLLRALQRASDVQDLTDPLQSVMRFKQFLLHERFHLWPTITAHEEAPVLIDDEDSRIPLRRNGLTQVQDLLRAERKWCPWGSRPVLQDGPHDLPGDAIIHLAGRYGPYQLCTRRKSAGLPCDHMPICIQILYQESVLSYTMPAGGFLFEALWRLPSWNASWIVLDLQGAHLSPDQRQWKHITVRVPHPHGAGPLGQCGTFASQIWLTAQLLYRHATSRTTIPTIDPWTAALIMQNDHFGVHLAVPGHHFHVLIAVLDHWYLLVCHIYCDGLHIVCFDGLPHDLPAQMAHFGNQLADALNCSLAGLDKIGIIRQKDTYSCGAVMLAHLALELGLVEPTTPIDIAAWHHALLSLPAHLGPVAFGPSNSADIKDKLAPILRDRGVPDDRIEERIALAMQKIPPSDILQALNSKNAWPSLKALASRAHIAFMWIHPDELSRKIRERASSQFGVERSNRKQQGRGGQRGDAQPTPVNLDPHQLELVPGTFQCSDGTDAMQVAFSLIDPEQQGVAFCTAQEAIPFLQQGKSIAGQPLALLTCSSIPADHRGTLPVVDLLFPVHYQATNEPILVRGSLIQLGTGHIQRKSAQSLDLDSAPTQTLKIAVFQDAFPQDWATFTTAPVRTLQAVLPLLRTCRSLSCGNQCPLYHPPVDEETPLLLDIWSRQWHDAHGRKAKPDTCVSWSAMVRIPSSACTQLLTVSGTHGIFFEPRDATGRITDPAFGVVWLPGACIADIACKKSSVEGALGLARIHNKLGLRFAANQLEAAHKVLKPGEGFQHLDITGIYGDGRQSPFNQLEVMPMASVGKLVQLKNLQPKSFRLHLVRRLSHSRTRPRRKTPPNLCWHQCAHISSCAPSNRLHLPLIRGLLDLTPGLNGRAPLPQALPLLLLLASGSRWNFV